MTSNHRPLEEGDIELIERVRATPCLYDTREPDFRLVYKKEQQWQSVADGLIMTHWEARKRWTVLRDRYARELKQLLLHPDSLEYGKSEFFHRMDFLRNFVKKRSVRKKCNSSSSQHSDDVKKKRAEDDMNSAIPIKIFKVDSNVSGFESYENQETQQQNCRMAQQQPDQNRESFIIEDSQNSSTGRYSYIEEENEAHDAVEHAGDSNPMVGHAEREQEYQEYVEDTSAAYEAIPDNHDGGNTHFVSNHPIATNTIGNRIPTSISFINVGEKLTQLPQLQQRPSNDTTLCSLTSTTTLAGPNDSEEYFSKTIALYLKQLSRRYKIKAKVEMLQILEKYIELEEMKNNSSNK